MSIGATVGAVQTAGSLVGEIPLLGDVLGDIPLIGGLFGGGGPEDMDSGEITGKLYAGRWSELDDEMEPVQGVRRAPAEVQDLLSRMQQDARVAEAVNRFAHELLSQLQAKDLAQSVRGPRSGVESARVVVWAMRGGVGSDAWGPAAQDPARQIFALQPREPETASPEGAAGGLSTTALLAGAAAVGGLILVTR